jgi:2-amino-4-hydroxy-6-hydroxymethyldihydropteridine diphosphokinase
VTLALVALGSNLPPRRDTILSAIASLATLPETSLVATSTLRETEPVDTPPGSGAFINGACLLDTELPPDRLLAALQGIEADHGRLRAEPNAPRTLDLDLILHGEQVLSEPGLVLPHPRAHERLFVLEPAAEIAPAMIHPTLGLSLEALCRDRRSAQRSQTA